MMDKELREKIKEILVMTQSPDVSLGDIPFEDFWADQIIALIKEADKEQRSAPDPAKGYYNEDTIDDGFGSVWSAWRPKCGQKSMAVVRPGKVQCNNCG